MRESGEKIEKMGEAFPPIFNNGIECLIQSLGLVYQAIPHTKLPKTTNPNTIIRRK